MTDKTLQQFLEGVFSLADKQCGDEFAREMTAILIEREKVLKESWKKVKPEDIDPTDSKKLLREIDFDTIVIHAGEYLDRKEYLVFLFNVADMGIGFGEFEKAERLLRLLATRYARLTPISLLAKTHQKLAIIARNRNDFKKAHGELRKSLKFYAQIQDKTGIASVKNSTGILLVEQGRTSEGIDIFQQAKKIAKAEGLEDLLAKINMNIGNACTMCGFWEKAKTVYEETLSILGRKRMDGFRARLFHNMAIVYAAQDQFSKALESLHKSIEYSTRANDVYMKNLSYLEQAAVHCRQKDLDSATAIAISAFRTLSDIGDRLSIADVYKVLGMINRERNKFEVALSFFERSKRINEEYKNPLNLGETLVEMGQLYARIGNYSMAIKRIRSAIKCFKQINAEGRILTANRFITDTFPSA